MTLRTTCALLAGLAAAVSLSPGDADAQTKNWRVAVVTPPGHPYNQGLDEFKRLVEEGSNGQVEVTVFPSSQLGGEVESAKNVQLGTLEMTIISTSNTSPFYGDLEIFGVPYLFKSLSCAYKVLDGPLGQEMAEGLRQQAGMRVLGWYTFGMRQLFNTQKPLLEPSDLDGLMFRVPADQLAEAAYRAMGANPVPMDFPEMFSALQQGVIDGADNPLITLHQFKWYEVVKFASISNTAAGLSPFLVNERVFASLPEDVQQLVIDAGQASAKVNREVEAGATSEARNALEAEGVRIDEVDVAAFREAVEPVFESARERFGEDLLMRIEAEQTDC